MDENATKDNGTGLWNMSEPLSMLFTVVDVLDMYYLPTIIVVGLVGNTISFVAFLFSALSALSLSVYLAALAVSDSLFLLSLAVTWMDNTGLRLFHRHGWCQLTVYVSYACSCLSIWCIVSYTVERYIAICRPMQRPKMCTTGRARLVVLGLCTASLLIYSCTLRISGVAEFDDGGRLCTPYLAERFYVVHVGLTYADTAISLLVPFVVILLFNFLIFRKMRSLYKQKNEHIPISSIQHCPPHCHRHPNASVICQQNQSQVKVTKSMLVVSTVFLVVSLPSYIIRVWFFVSDLLLGGFRSTLEDALLQQLGQFLFYLNYCNNVIVYFFCWSKFRRVCFAFLLKIKARVVRFYFRISRSTELRTVVLTDTVTDYT